MIFIACNKNDVKEPNPESENPSFISAVDISSYPEISDLNPSFFDSEGSKNDFLTILKNNGINTIRLRLWVHPNNEHSGFDEVKEFSKTLKSNGFKTWLTLHYSDTWADPGRQETPAQWKDLSFTQLKDSVYNYTSKVMTELEPDFIQIGNEINPGFLHPHGRISNNVEQFKDLIDTATVAVRTISKDCKIILHFAGIENSEWFFNQVKTLNYDIIGLSYYPIWHGKSLDSLKTTMRQLSQIHNKQIIIAETAYPFTLGWNDWTNNIVGSNEQLILPTYLATNEGQAAFIKDLITMTKEVDNGIGICYWGAELIAWKGNQSTTASPWENQALFDFNNTALPVLKEFNN